MNALQQELAEWPSRLDAAVCHCGEFVKQYRIVSETSSTQDAARQANAAAGTVIVTGAQTSGRGRYGRSWGGEPQQGVAMSLVLLWNDAPQMAIACAIGVVNGLRALCSDAIELGIKWPNDVLARDVNQNAILASGDAGLCHARWRKVCGILVEQSDDRAIVGVGINVAQTNWPAELAERAVSLKQLGCNVSRIAVLEAVLPEIDAALAMREEQFHGAFADHDVLTGTAVRLRCGTSELHGRVLGIDPLLGLNLQPDGQTEPVWCPAESTTLHAFATASKLSKR